MEIIDSNGMAFGFGGSLGHSVDFGSRFWKVFDLVKVLLQPPIISVFVLCGSALELWLGPFEREFRPASTKII